MSAVETYPIVAGFDAGGDWHDGGNGKYAKPGWSSAKALAIRAVRGAFALAQAQEAGDDGVDLEAADDYLSRLGVAKGAAVRVRYVDEKYGLITPEGGRPVKVKWERFADHLPAADAPRVTPTVTKNTTKADKGVGRATAARIKAEGGTGQVVVADGYLARHGHPKGATATVDYVDDVHADVHPAEPGGRKVRSKWSHFEDTLVPVDEPAPAPEPFRSTMEASFYDDAQRDREIAEFDALPDDAPVVVFHGTTADRAESIERTGVVAADPRGDSVSGVTQSTGMYVAPTYIDAERYAGPGGKVVEMVVPKRLIEPSPEARDKSTGAALYHSYEGAVLPAGASVSVTAVTDGRTPAPPVDDKVQLHPSAFDPDRPADAEILDWLAKPGLSFTESEAMDLHSAKLTWLFEEGIRRGWNHDQARKAAQAIDTALDESSDTMFWDRSRLVEAVDRVDSGRIETDLDRGVLVQRAYTDAVWQARYGDATSIEVTRVVSHDDPDRSTTGMPVDGVSSWVVRENEQQVIDWFARRDLTPEVIRSDIDRDRALMLPWGEGRYRSDYVRIKGEVLAGPDRTPAVDAREVLLDPDAERDAIARAVFAGKVGGVNVNVVKVQVNTRTTGPDHLARTAREVGALVSVNISGVEHEVYVSLEIAPGLDGDPHITLSPSDFDAVFEPYLDAIADRVGVDTMKAFTSTGQNAWSAERMRQFVEAGWGWHPQTDRAAIRWFGEDILASHPDNALAKAWKNWDKADLSAIPSPQALLDPENAEIRPFALDRIWYTGIKDRTGRVAVPSLPRQGSYIDWSLVPALPDGTHLAVGSKSVVVSGGKVYPFDRTPDPAQVDWFDASVAYPPNLILDADGEVPSQARLIRYRSMPLPEIPAPPEPYPGVAVRGKITPARPLVFPGLMVGPVGLTNLPEGTRVRKMIEQRHWQDPEVPQAYDGVDGYDWIIGANGTMSKAHDHTITQRLPTMENEAWMVTALPTDNLAPTPTPDEFQQRIRTMLLDETRRHKIPKNGIGVVAPLVIGAIDPADWTASVVAVGPAHRVLAATTWDWRAENWPPHASYESSSMNGAEVVGPVWRIPGRGTFGQTMFSTTPIEGVEPETLSSGSVNGALRDDTGYVLWAKGARTPVPWRDPQPSPLTDEQVTERIAKIGTPPGDINVTSGVGVRFSPGSVAAWLHQSADKTGAYRITVPGAPPGAPGPPRTVVIGRPFHSGPLAKPYSIGWLDYPIGSPEAVLAGIDPNDPDRVVLPIDDPRLRQAIDAAWWARSLEDGTIDSVEQGLISENPKYRIRNRSLFEPDDDGAVKAWDSPQEKIQKYLVIRSNELRQQVARDGMISVKRNGNRFVVSDSGTPIPLSTIPYLRSDGDEVVAYLNHEGVVAALGDAGTPDYGPVYAMTRPWEDRVAHLVAQREKVLLTMPGGGERIDAAFAPVDTSLEHRLWTSPSASDREHMRRARAIEEYGKAVAQLWVERFSQIRSDPERDGTYIDPDFPSSVMTPLTPGHTKALKTAVAKVAADLYPAPWEKFNDNDLPAFLENPTVVDILDRLARGDVHVKYKPPTDLQTPTDQGVRDSLGAVRIETNVPSNIERRRGPYIEFRIGKAGTIGEVAVHDDGASFPDSAVYVGPDFLPDPAAPLSADDIAARRRLGKRLMKLAEDIGLVSAADPRPTLGEIAFLETLEAMGVDMGTNGRIEVGSAKSTSNATTPKSALTTLGRSTSPEAYAADMGLNMYPRDWTDWLVGKPQRIDFQTDTKYTVFGGGSNTNGGDRIKIADPRQYPATRSSIVHEFGHSVEGAVPGVPAAEAWYLASRLADGPREEPFDTGGDGFTSSNVVVYRDQLPRTYTGRIYNQRTLGGNDWYEVFTTGAETIIGNRKHDATDERLQAWLSGLLSLFRPVASKP